MLYILAFYSHNVRFDYNIDVKTLQKMITSTNCVGYLRVSTKSQGRSGWGIAAQKSKIKEYAKTKGWTVNKFYTDVASGTAGRDKRPALDEMISNLNSGTVVLISKRDRLARDMFLNLWLEKQINAVHAVIESASNEGNGEDPSSQLMKNIVQAFSSYERSVIAQRTRDSLAKIKESGKRLGAAPFGWKFGSNGTLKKDPKTLPHRIRIEELIDTGYGWNKIARILNDEGIPTQKGKKWYASTLWNMFQRVVNPLP